MTSGLFTDWIQDWDKQLRRENRKILLLVDNCSAHPKVQGLTNIELRFLPPNTTSIIQPMDQGVIKNLKTLYRREVLSSILAEIDNNHGSEETAVKIARRISILSAIYMIATSWDAVKSTTVSNCFRKGGFVHGNVDGVSQDISPEGVEELPEDWVMDETYGMNQSDFTSYVNIDSEVQCSPLSTEEDIVESIAAKRARVETASSAPEKGEEEKEEEEEEEAPTPVTFQEATQCMAKIKQYVCQLDNTDSKMFEHLFALDRKINQSHKLRQSTIKDFFSQNST